MRRASVIALAVSLLSLAAAPAGAKKVEAPNPHQFTGSGTAEPRFTGESQEFKLKPFAITCEKAKSAASGVAPAFPSKTLTAVIKYAGCSATAKIGKTEFELKAKFHSAITFNFRANGVVEAGAGGTVKEGKLEEAGPIELSVTGPFKCSIEIAPGTFPATALKKPEAEFEAATYTNEETTVEKRKKMVVEHKLGIAAALTRLHYTLGGTFCEALPKTESGTGAYAGSLLGEIKNGSLGRE
jgi:hypothetical protein